jgi:hypothetical protein
MEWDLRKVLPCLTAEKQSAFARHIIPVIIDECGPAMSEAEVADLLMQIIELHSAGDADQKGEKDVDEAPESKG